MPTWQLCTRFQSYTATASTEATDHPASNAALIRWPLRDWRATTGVGAFLRIDLGAAVPAMAAFLLDDTSMTSVTIGQATSIGGSYTTLGTHAVNVDRRCNRRKGWLVQATTQRFVQFLCAAVVTGENARLGTLAAMQAANIVTMAQNPGRPQFRPVLSEDVLELPGGTRDVNTESRRSRIEYNLSQQLWKVQSGVLAQLQDAYHAADRTVALWENLGATEHAYLLNPVALDAMEVDPFAGSGGLALREW